MLGSALVRDAARGDFPAFLALLKRKAQFDGGLHLISASEEEIEAAIFGDPPRCAALVAEVESEVVGFATFFGTFSTFLAAPGLWLDDLFVAPDFRSRGIGALLLKRLAEIGRERDCARIDWTVAESNERGIRFYQRCGADLRANARLARLDRDAIEALASG